MTWTNAFDLGINRVEVFQVSTPNAPDYAGILTKGSGADFTLASWPMHIAVSSVGVVTLTNTGTSLEIDVGARIIPGYGVDAMAGAQAVLPTSASGTGEATANGSVFASFTNGDASADLSAQTSYDRISVQTATIGSSSVNPVVQFTPQFDVPAPPPPPPSCNELGRVTRSFVSGYTASRLESRRIRRFSKRCCVADFNGAMPLGVTITSVNFETTSPWSLFMSNPRIESTGRKAVVDVSYNFAGFGGLLVTATWSNGEVTNVEFGFQVIDRPLYPSAQYPSSNGPYILTATA